MIYQSFSVLQGQHYYILFLHSEVHELNLYILDLGLVFYKHVEDKIIIYYSYTVRYMFRVLISRMNNTLGSHFSHLGVP